MRPRSPRSPRSPRFACSCLLTVAVGFGLACEGDTAPSSSALGDYPDCGDGVVQLGEACDDAGDSPKCNVTCGVKVWKDPRFFETPANGGPTEAPLVAIDARGNALAVWAYGFQSSYASRYHVLTGTWSAPRLIEHGSTFRPRLAMNSAGDAMIAWTLRDGGLYSVRYTMDTASWQDSTVAPELAILYFTLVMDRVGSVTALWNNCSGQLYASRHTKGDSGWRTSTISDEDEPTGPSCENGTAFIVNHGLDGNALAAWAHRGTAYVARPGLDSGPWNVEEAFGVPLRTTLVDLVQDADGNAIAVWSDYARQNEAFATRYKARTDQWGPDVALTNDSGWQGIQVAVSPDGDGIAVWWGEENSALLVRTYQSQTNVWGEQREIRVDGQLDSQLEYQVEYNTVVQLAVDAQGNSVIAWRSNALSETRLHTVRHFADVGWAAGQTITATVPAYGLAPPSLAMNATGSTVLAWAAIGQVGSLYATVYD